MPQLGESIAQATIVRLQVAVGDTVRADQDIIEVETEKSREQFESPRTIIATGAVSAELPNVPIDRKVILTGTEG